MKDVYKEPQTDLCNLVNKVAAFSAFIPLNDSIKHKLVKEVAVCDVPAEAQKFPIFRDKVCNTNGSFLRWVFWDGNREMDSTRTNAK